ncbi:MAG: MotA/TolQ/ExbB proton channel family protein [Phycisphaeraceae bacterium]|nr:MotA/TolQ/ExbB proton channel family protein [Phycisphaeraceae bacterium]
MNHLAPRARASLRAPIRSVLLVGTVLSLGVWAMAQTGGATPAAEAAGPQNVTLWDLFRQSFDLFTILLVTASLVAWAVIIMAFIEIRQGTIAPPESEEALRRLAAAGQWGQVRQFVSEDDAFISRVVQSAMTKGGDTKDSQREAAELAASEESSRWFRKIEPLNILGNLGPLLGLAGTVWGMVIAFAALGQAGGTASPATLSLGISKALFHTLMGLLLAVPALVVFGFYRTRVDRLCTQATVVAAELVEMLPSGADLRRLDGQATPARSAQPMPARPGPVAR